MMRRWMDRYRGTNGVLGTVVFWWDMRWLNRRIRQIEQITRELDRHTIQKGRP